MYRWGWDGQGAVPLWGGVQDSGVGLVLLLGL